MITRGKTERLCRNVCTAGAAGAAGAVSVGLRRQRSCSLKSRAFAGDFRRRIAEDNFPDARSVIKNAP